MKPDKLKSIIAQLTDCLLPVGVKNGTISGFIFLSGENAADNIYLICNLYQCYYIPNIFLHFDFSFMTLVKCNQHVIIVLC